MKIHLIAAARPNFMKIAPLYHALKRNQKFSVRIVHTGQHYDQNMFADVFQDLNLPKPHVSLNIGSGTHAYQVGQVMIAYEKLCQQTRPDLVIVVGDVNSTMACTIAAKKMNIKVAHLEAGLRSFDITMPEEINRIVTDSIVDYHWTPSIDANENLLKAGITDKSIHLVGNIMIDSLEMLRAKIEQETFPQDIYVPGKYILVTLHRPSNVDFQQNLTVIVRQLVKLSELSELIFPIHPRTLEQLKKFDLYKLLLKENIVLTAPLSYKKFMKLVFNASAVVTDSGGIQEETTYLNIPCLTVRENTERPITITHGTNQLVAIEDIYYQCKQLDSISRNNKVIKYWDGNTAERIVTLLEKING